ncbi:MAG TPA: BtpA/SgcQ family protein [Candidatus Lokiarchaeia archaeon]|nr:BtpA/SgcQ family protein [Candidatus Lokiarchaeia archaeon]
MKGAIDVMKTQGGMNLDCIGMIHLLPLPGSPRYDDAGGLQKIIDRAARELEIYLVHGFDGVIFENFGDVPFYPSNVPPETIASMTHVITSCLHEKARLFDENHIPIGINVLRNDARAAIAIAKVVGAQFIRVNIHAGASVTDQGIIQGMAHEVMRYRQAISAGNILIFADVRVKHATPLHDRSIVQECEDLVHRALVDGALILTGDATGEQPSDNILHQVIAIKERLPGTKVLVGSGVNSDNIEKILEETGYAIDGCIVGTAFKRNGNVNDAVDEERVERFIDKLNGVSRSSTC